MTEISKRMKKVAIAIAGGLVVVLGIVLIPYPGPGWLVVFAGLAILATEFPWARKVLDRARGFYDKWQQWLKDQPIYVRIVVLALTGAIVLATAYLLNVFGILNNVLHLNQDWLKSPLF